MSNVLLGTPIWSDVGVSYTPVLSGGVWSASLPLANLQDRRLAKVARSSDDALTSTIVNWDLGVARAVRVVGAFGHNFSTAALARVRLLGAVAIIEDNDFNAWASDGTPTIATGQADPLGGTRATLIGDDDGAAVEGKNRSVMFTGNGTKAIVIALKAGTASVTTFGINDGVWRHLIRATWAAGVPTLSTEQGGGTLYTPQAIGGGFYLCMALVNSVVAANPNRFYLYPAGTTASETGNVTAYEATAWDLGSQPILYDSGAVAAWPSGIDAEEAAGYSIGFAKIFDAATARYGRLEIADTANPDNYIEIGRLIVAGGFQPTINASYGLKQGWEDDSVRTVTDGGTAIYQVKSKRRHFTFVLENLPETEALEGPFDIMAHLGTTGQLFFAFDPEDTTHLHRRSALCVMRELSPLEMATLTRYGTPFSLVEEL